MGTPPRVLISDHPDLGPPETGLPLLFPNLRAPGSFEATSDHTDKVFIPNGKGHNCIAWAAEQEAAWWWPDGDGYWPDWAPRQVTVASFLRVFRSFGYELCNSLDLEPGNQKVALYVDSADVPQHMARQLNDGTWTSKMGALWDISHPTVDMLYGGHGLCDYGTVRYVLRRRARKTLGQQILALLNPLRLLQNPHRI